MEPINKPERRKAYLNFVVLFLVCTAIIITTVFFSTRMPLRQNNELIEFRKSVNESNKLRDDFTIKLAAVSTMIDSLDKKDDITILDSRIESGIKELNALFPGAQTDENRIYINVISNLQNYRAAKKTARAGSNNNENVKALNEQISQLQRDNAQLLFMLKNSASTPNSK